MLATDAGRERFWVERSATDGDAIALTFANGERTVAKLIAREESRRLVFEYFGTRVEFTLAPDGAGGTDLTLTNTDVPDDDYLEMLPGWLNVLLPLKGAVDFGVDLRNHDPDRSWEKRYVDQ